MNSWLLIAIIIANLALIPLTLIGVIKKTKAIMQTRIGAPILQPFFDVKKMLQKSETISDTASWVFIWTPGIGLAVAIIIAIFTPWYGTLLPATLASSSNFILVLYMLALGRFFSLLAAMDTASAFGGLGASREATISLFVEPTMIIGLAALASGAGSMNLLTIYSLPIHPIIAGLVGSALLIAALAELSRMPVDDPTTHLELTMVHEAMILENSGRNLALIELTTALRTCIFLGLASQTLLHLWPAYSYLPPITRYISSILSLFTLGVIIAIVEGLLVKLKWHNVPNFLSFALVASIMAALIEVALI